MNKSDGNTLISLPISWNSLVGIAGLVLVHHDRADVTGFDDTSKNLAREISTQVAYQSHKQGIDPVSSLRDLNNGKVLNRTIDFNAPMWAVIFVTDILNALKDAGKVTTEIALVASDFMPFARAALDLIDGNSGGFGGDFPAHRLN